MLLIELLLLTAGAEDPPAAPEPTPPPADPAPPPDPAPAPAPEQANVGGRCRTDGDCTGPDTVCRKPAPGTKAAGIVSAGKLVVGTCTVPGAACATNTDCGEPYGECDDGECLGAE